MSVSFHITLSTVFLGGCEVKEIIPRDYMGKNMIKCLPFTSQLPSLWYSASVGLKH